MRFVQYESPRLFLDAAGEFLEEKEAVNNLILGLLTAMLRQESHGPPVTPSHMFSVENRNGQLVLVILLTEINLILYGAGAESREAIRFAASNIYEAGILVPGVVGPTELADAFASEWARLIDRGSYIAMQQRIFILEKVNELTYSPGSLRLAEMTDLPVVSQWLREFAESIQEPITAEAAVKRAQDAISGSSMFLWENEVPVSMVKKSRSTKNGVVIACVYTPPRYRNRGYASSSVASLSQLLLNEGKSFCFLYTDLANPVSNHIYSVIGYRPIQDSVMYRFR